MWSNSCQGTGQWKSAKIFHFLQKLLLGVLCLDLVLGALCVSCCGCSLDQTELAAHQTEQTSSESLQETSHQDMCHREHAFCNMNGLHSNEKIMSVSDKCSVVLSTEINSLWNKAAAERLLGADIRHVSSHKQDPCKQK